MARDLFGKISHSRSVKNRHLFDHCFILFRNVSYSVHLSLSFLRPDDAHFGIAALYTIICNYFIDFCPSTTLSCPSTHFAILALTPRPILRQTTATIVFDNCFLTNLPAWRPVGLQSSADGSPGNQLFDITPSTDE